MTKVALKDIEPNPFRHLERYPISHDKIEQLKASINQTGFWDNLVGRRNEAGKVEIAYGHHRLEALNQLYPPNHKIDIPIRELSNETMLQMMANENMQEWATNVGVLLETVESVVRAYADGLITLPPTNKYMVRDIRYAPSYRPFTADDLLPADAIGKPDKPFTTGTLAEFLGWLKAPDKRRTIVPSERLITIVHALWHIENGTLKRERAEALPALLQLERIVKLANRTTIAATNRTSDTDKQRGIVAETVEQAIDSQLKLNEQNRLRRIRKSAPLPDINDYAPRLASRLTELLDEDTDQRAKELTYLLQFKNDIEPAIRADLVRTLLLIAQRATDYAESFQQELTTERRLELVSSQR